MRWAVITIPRIRQKADEYAMNDFVSEINAQRARYGYDTHALLAQKIGVCQATASNYLRNPETIRLDALRSLVKQLRLDPVIVLKMLGYSQRDINNLARRGKNDGNV